MCRFHHALKTFTAWHGSPGPDGSLIWTSPVGRHYPTEPAHVLLDHPPGPDLSTDPDTAGQHSDRNDDPPPF